jgi:hypothetical protein
MYRRCSGDLDDYVRGGRSAERVAVTWTPCIQDYCANPFAVPVALSELAEFVPGINGLALKIWPGNTLSV